MLGERRAEIAVRPLLGERPCLEEDDRDLRIANLDARQQVRQEAGRGVGVLQQVPVAVLDHDGGAGHLGEPGQLEDQRAVVEGGGGVVTTLRVCQKIPSRPVGRVVKTNWERFSRARSRTRSMDTPLRRQRTARTSSTISASAGQPPSVLAQNTRLVLGQVSRTLRTRPPSMGSRTRYGNRESGSRLRATTNFTRPA